jgi:hypothetical protein
LKLRCNPAHTDFSYKDTKSKLSNLDFGLVLGWGYEFEIGLILNLRNYIGLNRILKDEKGTNLSTDYSLGYNLARILK